MARHDTDNCTRGPDCFGCKAASVQISPYATPSRLRPEHAPKREHNSFNRGVHRDANGSPIHRQDGSVIGLREPSTSVSRELRARAEAARAGVTPDRPRDRVSLSTQER